MRIKQSPTRLYMSRLERGLSLELTDSFPFNKAFRLPSAWRYTKRDARFITTRLRELLLTSPRAAELTPLYHIEQVSPDEVKIKRSLKYPKTLLGWHKKVPSWQEVLTLWGRPAVSNLIRWKVRDPAGLRQWYDNPHSSHLLPLTVKPRTLTEAKEAAHSVATRKGSAVIHVHWNDALNYPYVPNRLNVPAAVAFQKQVNATLNFILDPISATKWNCTKVAPYWRPIKPSRSFELYFYREHILTYSAKEKTWTIRTR